MGYSAVAPALAGLCQPRWRQTMLVGNAAPRNPGSDFSPQRYRGHRYDDPLPLPGREAARCAAATARAIDPDHPDHAGLCAALRRDGIEPDAFFGHPIIRWMTTHGAQQLGEFAPAEACDLGAELARGDAEGTGSPQNS